MIDNTPAPRPSEEHTLTAAEVVAAAYDPDECEQCESCGSTCWECAMDALSGS